MKSANFTECGARYMNDPSLIQLWNYTGPVKLIPANPKVQITFAGCEALCGTGREWYPWSVSSAFVTTWVLPIIGTLLQAPFESNDFWRTVKACCRWLGSPMASLSYILWNIEVSGNCALCVDMATPYDSTPDENSAFSSIRDSFYILININQYKMKPLISMTKEAEGLLRIALFSKDLKLVGTNKTLEQIRRKLAVELRSNRRRGVVPTFVSMLWFLFSLGISIQVAFGDLGNNTQAHNLAAGLLMSWFPILILCSIVDRNPVASDDIRRKINKMVDLVCDSLQNQGCRDDYINSLRDQPEAQKLAYWVHKVSQKAVLIKGDYFNGFGGQGRTRFHYGAAHAILIDIEKAYIADHGRNWLADEREARTNLVIGQVDHGLVWFDGRQAWKILAAFMTVFGTSAGAFIISYFTPIVGLSCRSGGYIIFVVIATALLIAEISLWAYTSPIRNHRIHKLVPQRLGSNVEYGRISFPGLAASKITIHKLLRAAERVVVVTVMKVARWLPLKRKASKLQRLESALHYYFEVELHNLTTRQWFERCFFMPLEAFNTAWLVYILMAQTTGSMTNCACQTSIWSSGGGYLDFTQWRVSDNPQIATYWVAGTTISSCFMGIAMIYIVTEWCMQAHLSTDNYRNAMAGLRKTRRFRRATFWLAYPNSMLVHALSHLARVLGLRSSAERKTLVWTKHVSYRPRVALAVSRIASDLHQLPFLDARPGRARAAAGAASAADGEKRPVGSAAAERVQKPSAALRSQWRNGIDGSGDGGLPLRRESSSTAAAAAAWTARNSAPSSPTLTRGSSAADTLHMRLGRDEEEAGADAGN